MQKLTLLLSSLLIGGAYAHADLTELSSISSADNGKIFVLTSQRSGNPGFYAETDVHMVGSFGYAGVGSGRDNMTMDGENINQQFAYINYKGSAYIYSVADGRFLDYDQAGEDPILVASNPKPVYIYSATKSNSNISGLIISFDSSNRKMANLNITNYQHYHGAKVVCSGGGADPDEGNLLKFFYTGHNLTEEQLNALYNIIDPLDARIVSSISAADSGKIFVISSHRSDNNGSNGLYAETDVHKVGSFGFTGDNIGADTYANSGRESMDIDLNNVNQQFAYINYNGAEYIYSIADSRFLDYEGSTATLVESSPKRLYVNAETCSGGSGFRMSFDANNHNNKNVNVTSWSHYHGVRIADGATPDNGNVMKFYYCGMDLSADALEDIYDIIDPNRVETARQEGLQLMSENVGPGYPSAAPREAFAAALSAVTNSRSIAAARNAYVASTDVAMPEDGKAYTIKAKHSDGSYWYMVWDEQKGHLFRSENAPENGDGIFVVKQHDDGSFALYHPNKNAFLVWYADGKTGAGNVANGFNPNYKNSDNNADIWFAHDTSYRNNTQSTVRSIPEEAFGTLTILAKQYNTQTKYCFAASKTSNPGYHNELNTARFFNNNLTSFFVFEEVANPLNENVPDMDGLEADINGDYYVTVAGRPYAFAVPNGYKAYFVADVQNNPAAAAQSRSAASGKAVLKDFAVGGQAVPANMAVVLTHESSSEPVSLMPATREEVQSVPEDFTNILVAGTAPGKPVYSNGSFSTSATGGYYLNVDEPLDSYEFDATRTSTGISEITLGSAANPMIFDLQGRRLTSPVRGLNIINGRKVLVK